MLGYVRRHVPEPGKAPLAGNSRRHRPRLPRPRHARARRRTCTTGWSTCRSIKELARRWFPRVYFAAPAKRGGHRALADIKESIAELRYYRERGVRTAARDRTRDQPAAIAASRLAGRQGEPARNRIASPRRRYTLRWPRPAIRPAAHGGRSSVGRAPGCGPGCRGFKSRRSPPRNAPRPHRRTGGVPACRTPRWSTPSRHTRSVVSTGSTTVGWHPARHRGAQRLDCARPPGGRTGASDRGCG